MDTVILRTFLKAHVHAHTRVVDGRIIYVQDYDSTRPQGRQALLHERITLGHHNEHGPYLRATDAADKGAILHASERLGIAHSLIRRAGANHHGRQGAYDHIHFGQVSDASRIHQALAGETGKVTAPEVRLEVQQALFAEAELSAPSASYPRPTIYCSGTNETGYIHGFADAGIAVGVSLSHMHDNAIPALIQVAREGAPIFVDNGAFSEVSFPDENGPPVVTKPISDAEWERRLDVYDRLARSVPNQLTAVAPDRIGDQHVTLQRLNKYKTRLQRLHNMGVRVLLPVQRGSMSQADFYRAAVGILGFEPVPAFPMKKSATPPEDVVRFIQQVQPRDIHLLGIGIQSDDAPSLLSGIHGARPGINVTMDSNLIIGNVGRTRGLAPLTRAQDEVREGTDEEAYGDGDLGDEHWSYTDQITGDCNDWLSKADRERVSKMMKERTDWFTPEEAKAFKKDPEAFFSDDDDKWAEQRHEDWWDDRYNPLLAEMDVLWKKNLQASVTQERKRVSIPMAFNEHGSAGQFERTPVAPLVTERPVADANGEYPNQFAKGTTPHYWMSQAIKGWRMADTLAKKAKTTGETRWAKQANTNRAKGDEDYAYAMRMAT